MSSWRTRLSPRSLFKRAKDVASQFKRRRMRSRSKSFDLDEGQEDPINKGQLKRPQRDRSTLVACGDHAGESLVVYKGHNLPLHLLTRDFFITVVSMPTALLLSMVGLLYLLLFMLWSIIWWLITKYEPDCLVGSDSYVEALMFAAVTQMTIGYGNTNPGQCWVAAWLVILQSIIGVIVEAVVIGIVFAKISHPSQRARSIFLSKKAVIARRDGILKFMFRVADIRATQVVEPRIKVYLYTWGDGRLTAEGECIPVRVEPLQVDYIDGQLLLPLIIEHTVDERSPLCGHTHDSLVALNAEIVVTFEGTTEAGNPFMARRSYIPEEIYWGYQFCNIFKKPPTQSSQYEVALDCFNKVKRQQDLPAGHPSHLSNLVVGRAKRTVPYPLLGENTLVLSDVLCVCPDELGRLCLFCRVGDTYPGQMIEIEIKMYLYRWKDPSQQPGADPALRRYNLDKRPAPFGEPYEQYALECGYEDGSDRLYLRLPTLVRHVIDEHSPLAPWLEEGGMFLDLRSEICVVINAYKNYDNSNVLRQRTYAVDHHVKYGYGFVSMVRHPALARDRKPRVRWQHFHDVEPADGMEKYPEPPLFPPKSGIVSSAESSGGHIIRTTSSATGLTIAPESHAGMRMVAGRRGGPFSKEAFSGMQAGVPPENNIAQLTDHEIQNESTVIGPDLNRYAAKVGGESFNFPGSPQEGSYQQRPEIHRDASRLFAIPQDQALQDSMDADTSMPYPAALHPALPGPDRFRYADETDYSFRNDYTVSGTDLHRYSVAVAAKDAVAPQTGMIAATITDESTEPDGSDKQIEYAREEDRSSSEEVAPSSISESEAMAIKDEDQGPGKVKSEALISEDLGPLTGIQPIERGAFLAHAEEDEEQGAGPMHFAPEFQKGRAGKSLAEISSLFRRGKNSDNKEEQEED